MIVNALIFFSSLLYAEKFDISLERNTGGIENRLKYYAVEEVVVDNKKLRPYGNYRIKLKVINEDSKNITTIVLKYSFRLVLHKGNNQLQTISLFSSSLRISEIKKNSSKESYVYDIKNLFPEISKFVDAGYQIDGIVFEIMKEPKKGEDITLNQITIPVKIK